MKSLDYMISASLGACLTLFIIWILGGSIAEQNPGSRAPIRILDLSQVIPRDGEGELKMIDPKEAEKARTELLKKARKFKEAGYIVMESEAVFSAPENQRIKLSFKPKGLSGENSDEREE